MVKNNNGSQTVRQDYSLSKQLEGAAGRVKMFEIQIKIRKYLVA